MFDDFYLSPDLTQQNTSIISELIDGVDNVPNSNNSLEARMQKREREKQNINAIVKKEIDAEMKKLENTRLVKPSKLGNEPVVPVQEPYENKGEDDFFIKMVLFVAFIMLVTSIALTMSLQKEVTELRMFLTALSVQKASGGPPPTVFTSGSVPPLAVPASTLGAPPTVVPQ
jgi:hypothetical protein